MGSRSCHIFFITFIVVVVIVFGYHRQHGLSFFLAAQAGVVEVR